MQTLEGLGDHHQLAIAQEVDYPPPPPPKKGPTVSDFFSSKHFCNAPTSSFH